MWRFLRYISCTPAILESALGVTTASGVTGLGMSGLGGGGGLQQVALAAAASSEAADGARRRRNRRPEVTE